MQSDPSQVPRWRSLLLGALALALLLLLGLLVTWRSTVGGEVLSTAGTFVRGAGFPEELRSRVEPGPRALGDPFRQFEPWTRYQVDHLREEGRLPLWKATTLCGAPLLGNGQSAVLAPLNLAAVALGYPPWANGVIALLKLSLGAFLAFLLARHLGVGPTGALISGISFGFFGFQVAFLLFPHVMVSMLLPALVLAADRAALRPTPGRIAVLAAVCALQHLGGHPETVFHAQAVAALLVVVRVVARRRAGTCERPARTVLAVAAGFVLGALLAAPHLFPLVEYIRESDALRHRSQATVASWAEAPRATAGFLACLAVAVAGAVRLARRGDGQLLSAVLLFGGAVGALRLGVEAGMPDHFASLLGADWVGDPLRFRTKGRTYVAVSLAYFGPAVGLAALGYLAGRPRPLVRLIAVVSAVCMLVAFRAPVFRELIELVPPFSLAANSRLTLVAQLGVALLAGLGFDALSSAAPRPALRRAFLGLTLASCAAIFTANAWIFHDGGVVGRPWFPPTPSAQRGRVQAVLDDVVRSHVGATGEPRIRIEGSLRAPEGVRPQEARLDIGSGRSFLTVLEPQDAGAGGSPGYRFATSLPAWSLAMDTQPARVVVTTAEGLLSSELLELPASSTPWSAAFPVMPVDGRAPQQVALLLAVIAGVWAALRWPGTMGRHGRAALLLATAAGVPSFARGFYPTLPRDCHFPTNPEIERMQRLGHGERVFVRDTGRCAPEALTWYGVRQLLGYDALAPYHVAELYRAALDGPQRRSLVRDLPKVEPHLPLLGMMGVSWLFRPSDSSFEPNPHFLPRARLVRRAEVEPDDERALARLEQRDFPHAGTVLLASGAPRESEVEELGSVSFERDSPDRVVLLVDARAPCTLVLADTYFPGWEATVDGVPREIQRANLAFRALPVGPADERVELRYRPASFRIGVVLSLAVLGAGAAWLLIARRRAGARAPGAGGSHPPLAAP